MILPAGADDTVRIARKHCRMRVVPRDAVRGYPQDIIDDFGGSGAFCGHMSGRSAIGRTLRRVTATARWA